MPTDQTQNTVGPGTLFVVPTPIGNLSDITTRAIESLRSASWVVAEDTRRTQRLLEQFGIKARLSSYHEHNEAQKLEGITAKLQQGDDVALVSDAGTPVISDPGWLLVREAYRRGIRVVPLPGACAAVCAMSGLGIAANRFTFEGFLSARATARRKQLIQLADESRTMVFYEAPHRITRTLQDMVDVWGEEREAGIARELTKMHEQLVRGTLRSLADELRAGSIPQRGEFVVVVAGEKERREPGSQVTVDLNALIEALLGQLGVRDCAQRVSELTGLRRREIYQRALELDQREG